MRSTQERWDIPTQLKKASWIDGYNKNLNGEDTLVFSYVVPLFDQNELIGVVGMDFSYNSLHETVADIQLLETGFATLLDRNNYVISHPSLSEGQTVANKFQDEHYAQIKDQFKALQNNAFKMGAYDIEKALGTELLPYTQDGEARMLMRCVLKNGMTLCLTAPQS